MFIRSQQKGMLLELNGFNIHISNNTHKWEIIGFNVKNSCQESYWIIGEYRTRAKAIKVLDMIQKKVIEIDENKFLGMTEAVYKNIVFEMPQDDEVK